MRNFLINEKTEKHIKCSKNVWWAAKLFTFSFWWTAILPTLRTTVLDDSHTRWQFHQHLRAALMLVDPESVKNTVMSSVTFYAFRICIERFMKLSSEQDTVRRTIQLNITCYMFSDPRCSVCDSNPPIKKHRFGWLYQENF